MTEKEAWLWIAEQFENNEIKKYKLWGICFFVGSLSSTLSINQEVFQTMCKKIKKAVEEIDCDITENKEYIPVGYVYPLEDWKSRADFCRKQANNL